MYETLAPSASRRQFLKLLRAAPMLPLAGAAFSAGCGGGDSPTTSAASYQSVEFTGMAAPTLATAAAMATTAVGSRLSVRFDDASSREYQLAYQPFFVTGDMVADGNGGQILAGGYYNIDNKPIIDPSIQGKERQFYSDSPDGT